VWREIEEARGKNMSRTAEIRRRLEDEFSPEHLEVLDESESHRGHAGFQEGGESHFRVRMTSSAFADQSRIARHRAVHSALGSDLMGRIHALALELTA
jgi:BolA family transcriptional regulator, general stress-responsive regulator